MQVTPPPVGLILRVISRAASLIRVDPKKRAASCRAKAKALESAAMVAGWDARHHELSSLTGERDSWPFHLRRARKLYRKRDRLQARALRWSMRAKKWEN